MCDCAEELERKSSRSHPIPPLQSEASSLCGWTGLQGSSPGRGGWAKGWVPVIGCTTFLFALFYKFKDKVKALLWGSDPCDGFVRKVKPVPQTKSKICDCKN
ncbi:uncharacterized protein LOC120625795 [Pararge aegeria]|uniref:uncharacterized protein LOC120625795 n=1 Tax=Pararge aegeria TaxID=116150 RepID=UPI0019D25F40|nr:uncharacterized protein LOC120625795 [Pararge aegeria]